MDDLSTGKFRVIEYLPSVPEIREYSSADTLAALRWLWPGRGVAHEFQIRLPRLPRRAKRQRGLLVQTQMQKPESLGSIRREREDMTWQS